MSATAIRMSRSFNLFAGLLLLLGVALDAAHAAGPDLATASGGLWQDVAERDVQPAAGTRWIVPERYRLVALDRTILQGVAFNAPPEGSEAARTNPTVIALPMPDGGVARFQIVETQVMAPELAAKFPDIRTWLGQGIDDRAATVRLDWTPQGFHAMVMSAATGRIFIDPYSRDDTVLYISYYTRDHLSPGRAGFFELPPIDAGGRMSAHIHSLIAASPQASAGTQLRTYRLAVAATGEFTAFHGGTVPLGQAAIVTAVNRINGIYEVEVAVRLQLVANNDLLVYTNATTDPYTNSNGSAMLGQNQSTVDAVIGSANYDVGHVFSTGGGGVAYLGVPCENGFKAGGVTGSSSPTGDAFWVDYVAHEMGHQFGGNHSFNGNAGSCSGGNRNAATAYEPGSGSTIMAYAGICGAQDLQPNSDPYFHTISFDEIVTYTTVGQGNTCGTLSATGNSLPVPSVPTGGFTIPARTPFSLTGSATDVNGDALTYNWEEYDLGAAGPPGSATNPPFFRSWNAAASSTRTFPRLSNLLAGTLATGEVLPNATRALNFRMTVRDNRAAGGGVAYGTIAFNVTTAAGPFVVTSPNTAVNWAAGPQTVTWDVASTNLAPVNCANVAIALSTDGGLTFPTSLAASTPNDGTQVVTIPIVTSTTARIKVACSSSIFFDISDVNFAIASNGAPSVTTNAATGITQAGATLNGTVSANGSSTTVTFEYGLTVAYGMTATAAQSPLAPGAQNAAVSAAISGLTCGTPYHFRAVAQNSTSTTHGLDATFVTAACPSDPWWDVFWRKSDGTNAIWQFTGVGPTQFVSSFPPGVPATWTAKATGDVNGDGVPDVVWFEQSSGQVAIWLMSSPSVIGSASFPGSVGAGSTWVLSAVGDVNGDGRADVVWRDSGTGQALVWQMSAAGTIASTLDLGVVPQSFALRGVGDFNDDGIGDLLWFQQSDGQVAVWLMAANGTHTAAFPGAVGPGTWLPHRLGDFDGDGKADVFWRDAASGMTVVWYLNGGTIADFDFFVSVPLADWNVGSVGDFDLDGRADVMWYAPGSGNVVRWLMEGRHVAPTIEALPGVGTGWQMVP